MNTTTAPDTADRDDGRRAAGTPAPLPAFHTPVRGHAFAPRHADTPTPQPGELAELVLEPDNPADAQAVAVWVGSGPTRRRIGYLDRGVAARIAPRLRAGTRLAVHLEGWTSEPEGRWQRPMIRLQVIQATELSRSRPARGSAARGGDTAPGASTASRGVWGRPPGVARRTLGPAP